MMIDIERFNPFEASEDLLDQCFAAQAAAVMFDNPEDPVPARDAYVGRLRVPPREYGPCLDWIARRDGVVVGVSQVGFPGDHNSAVAATTVSVHPAHRRAGVGTALLRAALPEMAARGRRTVVGTGLRSDGPGVPWARSLGFHETDRVVMQTMVIAEADPARWDVPVAAGYRLVEWTGAAPEALVVAFAAARSAIVDAPTSAESEYRHPDWSVDRVRAAERDLADRGVVKRIVVAVDADGTVAGLTELLRYPHKREFAYQGDTVVVAAHRGHGLGRAVKAAMMRRLTADATDVERIYTTTAESNTFMIKINEAIGYVTGRTMVRVEHSTAALTESLGARPA